VDFGDILKKWERQNEKKGEHPSAENDAVFLQKKNECDALLGNTFRGERRYRLLHKKPDALIDLHGLTRDEAWTALENFFENSRRQGLEKLLVVHGKGSHGGGNLRSGEAALRDLSRQFIETCSFAGESGYSSAREGGTGATWVILKE